MTMGGYMTSGFTVGSYVHINKILLQVVELKLVLLQVETI